MLFCRFVHKACLAALFLLPPKASSNVAASSYVFKSLEPIFASVCAIQSANDNNTMKVFVRVQI